MLAETCFLQENKINLALLWSKHSGNITSVNDLILGLDKKHFDVIFIYLSGYGVDKNSIEEAGYKVFRIWDNKDLEKNVKKVINYINSLPRWSLDAE